MRFMIVLAALAFGLAAGPLQAAEKVTLLLDWFVNPDHAAIVIAKAKGFFEREGLDVSFVEPADPSMPPRLSADPAALDRVRYTDFAEFMKRKGLIEKVEPIERYVGK